MTIYYFSNLLDRFSYSVIIVYDKIKINNVCVQKDHYRLFVCIISVYIINETEYIINRFSFVLYLIEFD